MPITAFEVVVILFVISQAHIASPFGGWGRCGGAHTLLLCRLFHIVTKTNNFVLVLIPT
jgi:hypothetical protein